MAQIGPFGGTKQSQDDSSTPQSGLVKNVCRKWTVHEDEGLAYRLQEAEFQNHFGRNKKEHHIIQGDIKEAKKVQNMELAEIEKRHSQHVSQLRHLEACDYELAEQLQQAILEEELIIAEKIKQRDEKLATKLQEGEKRRLYSERQMAPAPRQLVYSRSCDIKFPDRSHPEINLKNSASKEARVISETPTPPVSRQSSSGLKPNNSSHTEEERLLQELQDSELARKLQALEHEASQDDYRLALEAQDAEFARLLDEKEKERLQKLKEKQKLQKMKHSQNQESSILDDEFPPVSAAHYFPSTKQSTNTSENLVSALSNISINSRKTPILGSDPRTRPQGPSTQKGTINVATLIDPTYRPEAETVVQEYSKNHQGQRSSGSFKHNQAQPPAKNLIPRSQK